MKKSFSSLVSMLVVGALLALLFAIILVTLVFACSLAQSTQGALSVLVACGVGAIVIAALVSRLCLSNSVQARQSLRENTVALVGVTACMLAMGSACSLVGFGSFSKLGTAGVGRTTLLATCLIQTVLCCMMGKRLHTYLRRSDASVDAIRKEMRVLLLISTLLSAVDFALAVVGTQQAGVSLLEALFEDLTITYADLMWVELVLATVKVAAAASGVVLLRKRRVRSHASALVPSAAPQGAERADATLDVQDDGLLLAPDKTQVLNRDAIAA